MRFPSVLFAGSMAALLCLSSFAQTMDQGYGSQQQQAAPPAQKPAPAGPSSTPQLKLESLPPDPHTPTPEEEAAAAAARQRAQISRVAMSMANWGPKASTPGVTLTIKETGREKVASGTLITYRLTATGFAPGARLTLVRWPLNQGVTAVMNGIVIDSSGRAVCGAQAATVNAAPSAPGAASDTGSGTGSAAEPSAAAAPGGTPAVPPCTKTMQVNAPVEIPTTAAKGEAIRVALVAEDRKSGAAAGVVPFPIIGENNGCKLQVLLGSKDAELVLIVGDGFKPDVAFTAGTETLGQKTPLDAKPDAQGHFVAAMTPYVQGHDSGDSVIYYQSSACTPTVSFHWGKDTYKAE